MIEVDITAATPENVEAQDVADHSSPAGRRGSTGSGAPLAGTPRRRARGRHHRFSASTPVAELLRRHANENGEVA